jgi:3-methyladenine DNA glycosylase AlkD
MENIITDIRKALEKQSDPTTKKSAYRFFKECIDLYGVKTATVSQISKTFLKDIKDRPKKEIFDLCEILWQSGLMEESFIACHWSYSFRKSYKPSDFWLFRQWIDSYVCNWASCDSFCNRTMGEFLQMYPDFLSKLMLFTQSKNRWMRRASAVSLILPARKGMWLDHILHTTDLLLIDNDDMVQKGYGWMLKEASKIHQNIVFDYVVKNKKLMPRTALRYAIEKMPEEMKKIAMAK